MAVRFRNVLVHTILRLCSVIYCYRILLLATLLMAVAAIGARAQHDSKGKEFWITFMACAGSREGELTDMRIYLGCDRPASATVTYGLTGRSITILLPTPNKPVEVNISKTFGGDAELDMVNGTAGEISDKSFHIVADNDITLYGVSVRKYSGDAFLGLPDEVLTGRYVVLAYPNGFDSFVPESYDMPSEFAVVASEDGTTLRITSSPDASINGRPAAVPFSVSLNRGQVFFGQAKTGEKQDVSGTEIIANKPVAVFGGVRRTSIPTSIGNFRDYLCEQMPPLQAWGKEAIVTPHFNITPSSKYPAVVRVLAAFDGTQWSLDGTPQTPLQKGISMELPLTGPMHISADNPIIVAQYEHSVGEYTDNGEFDLGDPFMMLIPPSEQFDTAYAFQSIDHEEFLAHFINVVIPTDAIPTIRLDGSPIAASFTPVPTTRFSYAQVKVAAGGHYIRADSGFGLYAYGYGHANSYGYPGGTLFRTLVSDFQSPDIAWDSECARFDAYASDSHITDTGIDSCYATRDTSNVSLTITPFARHADTVRYQATLVDPYQDGVVGVKVIDSVGRSRTQINPIPGFTLRTVGMNGNVPLHLDTLVVFNGAGTCQTIRIENYGRFPQTIDSLWIASPLVTSVTTSIPLPMTIDPGGTQSVEICVQGWSESVSMVALDIAGKCARRHVADLPILGAVDTTAPDLVTHAAPCGDERTLAFQDMPARASGIDTVIFDTLINCQGSYTPDQRKLPRREVTMDLRRIDPRQDMIYQVTVIDAAGNRRTDSDTIPGFTLAVYDLRGMLVGMRGEEWEGDTLSLMADRCDSIVLHNYGIRPLRIMQARMRGNIIYSIPPTQLPLEVAPHSSRSVAVCIEGKQIGDQGDTLYLLDECGHQEEVKMATPVRSLLGIGSNGCRSTIMVESQGAAKRTFIMPPAPNPLRGGKATVDLGLAQGENVTLQLLDMQGESALDIMRNVPIPAGVVRIQFDISDLNSGAYFCRMTTSSGGVHVEKLIIQR